MSNSNQQNMISQGTTIIGNINSSSDFRVEGNVKGELRTSGKVVVGKSGVLNGKLEAENADFEGSFSGKLKLNGTLTLRSSAYIEGEVEIAKLSVEPGATFNAICSMKGGVKELKNSEEKGSSEKKEKSA
ncbi:MAG: hypothetical protein CMC36_01540 [Flavobacteriaceae bacterium]|nr:hypothetical protein [Flavobacteriaceae bacterium]